MTTKLPTLKDELDRKAVDALEWLVTQQQQGRISEESLYIARVAMFKTVSGLVDRDIAAMTHSDPPPETSGEIKAVLHKSGNTVVLRRQARGNIVAVTVIRHGQPLRRFEKHFDGDQGPARANEWISKMREAMSKSQAFLEL